MKAVFVLSLALTLPLRPSFAAPADVQCFAAREAIYVGGRPIGYYQASARLATKAGQRLVSFSVSMPDSGQVLGEEGIPSIQQGPGKLSFQFVDGWGNKSAGSLTLAGKRATLTLTEVEVAPGSESILRNYGVHQLLRSRCR